MGAAEPVAGREIVASAARVAGILVTTAARVAGILVTTAGRVAGVFVAKAGRLAERVLVAPVWPPRLPGDGTMLVSGCSSRGTLGVAAGTMMKV